MLGLRFQAALKLHRMKHLVEAQRRPKSFGVVRGFIVDFSDSLLLLHRLEEDTFQINGFTAVRLKDVNAVRFFDSSTEWQRRAVECLGLRPSKPAAIRLASLHVLLTSAGQAYPLISIEIEARRPGVCFIGEVAQVSDTSLLLEELDYGGTWCGRRRIRLADITLIAFGGGYLGALALTAPKRKNGKK